MVETVSSGDYLDKDDSEDDMNKPTALLLQERPLGHLVYFDEIKLVVGGFLKFFFGELGGFWGFPLGLGGFWGFLWDWVVFRRFLFKFEWFLGVFV